MQICLRQKLHSHTAKAHSETPCCSVWNTWKDDFFFFYFNVLSRECTFTQSKVSSPLRGQMWVVLHHLTWRHCTGLSVFTEKILFITLWRHYILYVTVCYFQSVNVLIVLSVHLYFRKKLVWTSLGPSSCNNPSASRLHSFINLHLTLWTDSRSCRHEAQHCDVCKRTQYTGVLLNIGFVPLGDTSERVMACLFAIFGDRGWICSGVHLCSHLTRSYNPLSSISQVDQKKVLL